MDWKTETFSLGWLKLQAVNYSHPYPIIRWLKDLGIMPEHLKWDRRNSSPRTLDADAIPAGYLAEVGLEWDEGGITTPLEFIEESLEFEVKGTMKHQTVEDLRNGLGYDPDRHAVGAI